MDNFAKYKNMRDDGASPEEVYSAAQADKLNPIESIRMLRRVFGLALVEAKEVTVIAKGLAQSLSEYQAAFIPLLDQLEGELKNEDEQNN